MMSEPDDHVSPGQTVRLLDIERQADVTCGFHLTRSKWDPYPWVSGVDSGSAADVAGMRPGDCLLEVNGEDVVGQRVGEIAEMVRSRPEQVSLLLWNAGVNPQCDPESLCCGPMPSNMQRLSTCMTSILTALECPVCLDTIPPPACQCVNGHLVCARCHAKSERCPVCRVRISRGRSLIADQVYNSLTDAFGLSKESDEKTRRSKLNKIFKLRNKKDNAPEIKVTPSHTNKFLARLVDKRSSSVENLPNQFLSPHSHLMNEFNSDVRAKSLSTSEIFCPGIPSPKILSRSGSELRVNKTDILSRMNLCRRSFESLNGNICADHNQKEKNAAICMSGDIAYHCPYSADCDNLVKGDSMMQHFRDAHDGPLIQYFKSKITYNLLDSHDNTYYILHSTGNSFFLKINSSAGSDLNKKDCFHDILIWMWLMNDQNTANEYQLQIYIYYSTCPDKLLSLNSAVYSLCNMSWKDMHNMQNGVFLSSQTLRALSVNTSDTLMIDVEIKHKDK